VSSARPRGRQCERTISDPPFPRPCEAPWTAPRSSHRDGGARRGSCGSVRRVLHKGSACHSAASPPLDRGANRLPHSGPQLWSASVRCIRNSGTSPVLKPQVRRIVAAANTQRDGRVNMKLLAYAAVRGCCCNWSRSRSNSANECIAPCCRNCTSVYPKSANHVMIRARPPGL